MAFPRFKPGGQHIALRVDGVLTYLHGDHLGSASLATDAHGAKLTGSDARYFPYGALRPGLAGATLPTDRRYTGQRFEASLGLYDYNARYYNPTLGRFISADTIVPSPGDPQSLNRYAYVRNNPLKYTDPSSLAPISKAWKQAFCEVQGRVSNVARDVSSNSISI